MSSMANHGRESAGTREERNGVDSDDIEHTMGALCLSDHQQQRQHEERPPPASVDIDRQDPDENDWDINTEQRRIEDQWKARLESIDDAYARLLTVKRTVWKSEHTQRVYDLRYRDRDNPALHAHKESTTVDGYRSNFTDHLQTLMPDGARALPRGARVLDLGAAPGGTSKFFCEDCDCDVLGVTIETDRKGFKMLYSHRNLFVLFDDLAQEIDEQFDRFCARLEGFRPDVFRRRGEVKFKVVHCGAVLQSAMVKHLLHIDDDDPQFDDLVGCVD